MSGSNGRSPCRRIVLAGCPLAYQDQRRPALLLSGKLFCAICGRGLALFRMDYLGYRAAKHAGCHNKARVQRQHFEARRLYVMGRQLLQEDPLAAFTSAIIGNLRAGLGDGFRVREVAAAHPSFASAARSTKGGTGGEALGLPLGLPQCAPPAAAPPFLSNETATIAHTSTAPSKPKQSAYPISVAWARML